MTELESILKAVAPADRPHVPIVFFAFRITVMLFALIFRGIAFEFRFHARALRRGWDYAFAAGSVREFVGAALVVLRPVILAYLGHASWVFRVGSRRTQSRRSKPILATSCLNGARWPPGEQVLPP